MKHLIICREYPPAPLPPGGIGTYVLHIARLLAEHGETVHVIAERWNGAPRASETRCAGRLLVHRVAVGAPLDRRPAPAVAQELAALRESAFRPQAFAYQAALLAERLVERDGIDVIEAQEWEAPLYFFQLRRALGLGPTRRPPCLVHLHSPTELIVRANRWDAARADHVTARRLEEYSIGAADALVCPSRYLARQAEAHYALAPGTVAVIPLPIGDGAPIARPDHVWKDGTICYVGRLEPRKGVLEWVEAAVAVAMDHPSVHFELIGADLPYAETLTVRQHLERRIPERLRRRFHFRGSQPRARLRLFLAQARIAVVPSRWENFPNTCVEAMVSGLPVIASPNGGMAEMVEDGRTGWVAAEGPGGLEDALRRAVATPPPALADMGAAAAHAIRARCDNDRIVSQHLELRRRVAGHGSSRSGQLPACLSRGRGSEARKARAGDHGVGIVITALERPELLGDCLASIADQIRQPVAVAVIADPDGSEQSRRAVARARAAGCTIVADRFPTDAAAKNAGFHCVAERRPLGVVFLDAADRLAPEFVQTAESVLGHRGDVGVAGTWTRVVQGPDAARWQVPACPAFPYQLVGNDVPTAAVYRTEAIQEVGLHRVEMGPGWDRWDLANAVLATGWSGATIPAVLASRVLPAGLPDPASPQAGPPMRRELLERLADLLGRDAVDVAVLLSAPGTVARGAARPPARWRGRLGRVLLALRHPRRALRALGRRARAAAVTATAG
jgi:glycogen synthase